MKRIFLQKLTKITKDIRTTILPLFPSLTSFPSVKILLLLSTVSLQAEVAPAVIRIPQPSAWTGQRLPIFIDLRAGGSFQGAASFEIPEIPGTVILKIGGTIVSSERLDGASHAVQTHEFALFSQTTGALQIPPIKVRFGARDTFTSPAREVETIVPATPVEIKRPPESDDLGFLITTDSWEVSETWNPSPPTTAKVGDVFKRTIIQRAGQMTGMALIPAPTRVPEGIRTYPPKVEIFDKTERGDFLGERRETLTYQITGPGSITLPEIRYVWWNPKTRQIQSQSLPSLTLVVPLPPAPSEEKRTVRRYGAALVVMALAIAAGLARRQALLRWLADCKQTLNPPHLVAARKLYRACRNHDAKTANSAWNQWRAAYQPGFQPSPALQAAVVGMQRAIYGPTPPAAWNGESLSIAFQASLAEIVTITEGGPGAALPSLNPGN